jgi:diguanylate cyclase (GGDEF)-like protein
VEAELRYRAETVRASFLPTYGLCVAGLVYVALTLDESNRALIAAVFAVGVVSTFVLSRLPMGRIVASRYRELFFVGWSVADIALIAVAVAADGGVTSPVTLCYLFPLLFSSLSYPARSIAIVYAAALSSYALVGLGADLDAARVFMGLGALAMAPFIGFLQVREHERERRALKESARTDALTGLLNHTAFQEQLAAELETADALALLALDVDRFKAVNDRHGHAAGDRALRDVADAVRAVVRPGDHCGRMGGDEFMLALPGADPPAAQRVAERLTLALSQSPVTVSIGIAVFPGDASEREQLMHCADTAMYARKRAATLAPA